MSGGVPDIICNRQSGGIGSLQSAIGNRFCNLQSAIGRHLEQHGLLKTDLVDKQSSVLKKCRSKFDCLIFEMLFINELNPKLNTQKDSIRTKLFTSLCVQILSLHIFTFILVS